MIAEDISTPDEEEENLDDPFDLDIQLYPVSAPETGITWPEASFVICTTWNPPTGNC